MKIESTPDQQAFVRDAVASGRIRSDDDAVPEALSLREHRERAHAEILATFTNAECSTLAGRWTLHSVRRAPLID
jgi:hypothetical protein